VTETKLLVHTKSLEVNPTKKDIQIKTDMNENEVEILLLAFAPCHSPTFQSLDEDSHIIFYSSYQ